MVNEGTKPLSAGHPCSPGAMMIYYIFKELSHGETEAAGVKLLSASRFC